MRYSLASHLPANWRSKWLVAAALLPPPQAVLWFVRTGKGRRRRKHLLLCTRPGRGRAERRRRGSSSRSSRGSRRRRSGKCEHYSIRECSAASSPGAKIGHDNVWHLTISSRLPERAHGMLLGPALAHCTWVAQWPTYGKTWVRSSKTPRNCPRSRR